MADTPALAPLFDLLAQYPELPEPITHSIRTLRNTTPHDLVAALAIAESVQGHLDDAIAELIAAQHNLSDPVEIRRQSDRQGKHVDTTVQGVKRSLSLVGSDWKDRVKRQLKQPQQAALEALDQALPLVSRATPNGEEFRVEEAWWAQYRGFVDRCTSDWASQVTASVDQALSNATATAVTLPQARGQAVSPPETRPVPPMPASYVRHPEPHLVDLPSIGGALFKYVRSHLMGVAMVGTLLATPLLLLLAPAEAPGTMAVRSALGFTAFPLIAGIGIYTARRERHQAFHKAHDQAGQKARRAIETEVDRRLRAEQELLTRWIDHRILDWEEAVDEWRTEQVDPHLRLTAAASEEQALQSRLRSAQLADRLQGLQQTMRFVRSKVLPALRRGTEP